jgi:uncharacterized protein YuzE
MEIEYDSESDGAFLWIVDDIDERNTHKEKAIKGEIWPKETKEEIGFLFGQDNKLIGIELLFASKYLPSNLLTDTYSKDH